MIFSRLIAGLLAFAASVFITVAQARADTPSVGTEQVSVSVPGDAAMPVRLFYPSTSAAQSQALGPFRREFAMTGAPVAGRLPLIVLSHGTGGFTLESVDLAMDLAKAGFVVAAPEHIGDNYRDRSRSFTRANFAGRPLHIRATIDFLLTAWQHKDTIDPARIGMFGHSAGGATSLIVGAGVLDFALLGSYCANEANNSTCKSRSGSSAVAGQSAGGPPIAAADPRVKALVVAAPAFSQGFTRAGLERLRIPVQLWVAEKDAIVTDAGRLKASMARRPERHDVANAGHFSFLAPCSDMLRATAAAICTDPQGFDRAAFQREFSRAVIRFFRAHLRR